MALLRIPELIKNRGQFSYSLEITPSVTEEEIDKLEMEPVFFSITWHSKSHQCSNMNIEPLRIAKVLTSKHKHILFHISCDLLREEYLKDLLVTLQEMNICNLFLILGENHDPSTSDFKNTSQLIKFIRIQTGNYFCIGVAGFPDCSDQMLLYMKEKIEMGAEFIITQAFFDVKIFKSYTERCKTFNINVPIIPGIFPFESHTQLISFTNFCKILVTDKVLNVTKTMEDLNQSCLELIKLLLQELQNECIITHYHLFSLNKLQRINSFIHDYNLNNCLTEHN